jgi:hypothetical protein
MEIIEIIKRLSENNYLGLVIVFMIISQYFIIKNNTNNFNLLLRDMINDNKEIQKEMLSELKEIHNDIREIKNELKEKSKV